MFLSGHAFFKIIFLEVEPVIRLSFLSHVSLFKLVKFTKITNFSEKISFVLQFEAGR